jgi:Domain of unknown function (DUF222)
MCSNSGDVLLALEEALEGVAAVTAAGPAGSGDRIGRLLAAKARLDAALYAEVATFDATGGGVVDGAAPTAGWLRAQHRLGRRDASGLVHQARRLRDLPATSAALTAGRISREHATAIIKAQISTGLDPAGFDRFEAILVDLAAAASPDEVRTAAAHLLDVQDPDRDAHLVAALAGRRFDLVPVGDLVKVDAMIDPSTAETLLNAVDALSRPLPGDDRTWHQRRADAFSAIIESGVQTGDLAHHGRTTPHLSIVVTLDQLTGVDGAGTTTLHHLTHALTSPTPTPLPPPSPWPNPPPTQHPSPSPNLQPRHTSGPRRHPSPSPGHYLRRNNCRYRCQPRRSTPAHPRSPPPPSPPPATLRTMAALTPQLRAPARPCGDCQQPTEINRRQAPHR